MPSSEQIVLSWEAWQASRAAKRALLDRLGLEAPSRRQTAVSSQDKRLRKAFAGRRAPDFRKHEH